MRAAPAIFHNAVHRAVLVGDFGQRRRLRGLIQQRVDRARAVRIQHEDLAEVRVRVAQQLQPILLGAGQRLLVAMHHAARSNPPPRPAR